MKILKKLFVAAAVFLAPFGLCAASATGIYVDGVSVGNNTKGKGWNYDTSTGRLHLTGKSTSNGMAAYDITGENTDDKVRIKIQANAIVNLNGVTLYEQKDHNAIWLDESKKSLSVTIVFSGKNELMGGENCAGIGVWPGQTLQLTSFSDTAELRVYGGKFGAGIGGEFSGSPQSSNCGNVVINGDGKIVVRGGACAAGIGGGGGAKTSETGSTAGGRLEGTVEIRGGTVIAYGGEGLNNAQNYCGGAGIGGGSYWRGNPVSGSDGGCHAVKILGGVVKAYGGNGAAGIGGACNPGETGGGGGDITIDGAQDLQVFAYGGKQAPGIGNALDAHGSHTFDLLVNSGTVKAFGGRNAAGIGGAVDSDCGDVTIMGGRVFAYPNAREEDATTAAESFVLKKTPAGIGCGMISSASEFSKLKRGNVIVSGGTIETTTIGGPKVATGDTDNFKYEAEDFYEERFTLGIAGGCVILHDEPRAQPVWRDKNSVALHELVVTGFSPGQKVDISGQNGTGLSSPYGKLGLCDIYSSSQSAGRIDGGTVCLWWPAGTYELVVNGQQKTYGYDAAQKKFVQATEQFVNVTFDANGGIVKGSSSYSVKSKYKPGDLFGELPTASRSGYVFLGWRREGAAGAYVTSTTPVPAADGGWVTLKADWQAVPQQQLYTRVYFELNDGSGSCPYRDQEVGRPMVLVDASNLRTGYSFLGWYRTDNGALVTASTVYDGTFDRVRAQWQAIGAGTTMPGPANDDFENPVKIGGESGRIANLPLAGSTLQPNEPFGKFRIEAAGYVQTYNTGSIWYSWTAPKSGLATFYTDDNGQAFHTALGVYTGCLPGDLDVIAEAKYADIGDVVLSFECVAGREYRIAVGCWDQPGAVDLCWSVGDASGGTAESPEAVWLVDNYNCAPLENLGVVIPTGEIKEVKVEGIGGLKVGKKSEMHYYLEGVPDETLDNETRSAVVRFKFKDKKRSDDIQALQLKVIPDRRHETEIPLGVIYEKPATELFERPVDANWTITGEALGIHYAKSATTWKDDQKNKHSVLQYTVYGQPDAVGNFTLTAKVKVQGVGAKTSFTEKHYLHVMIVPPNRQFAAEYRDVYLNAVTIIPDLQQTFALATDSKTKDSGLPDDLEFTHKAISYDKTVGGAVPAGAFYGIPKEVGKFAVTLKDKNKNKAYYLIEVKAPTKSNKMLVNFGATKTAILRRRIAGGDLKAEKNRTVSLMTGTRCKFQVNAPATAKVTAAGLPDGLKVTQMGTPEWWIAGVPSKVGSFFSTVTVTEGGIATKYTFCFEVAPNAFTGEYRGYMVSHDSPDDREVKCIDEVLINVAAGGASKVTLTEKGVKTAYSVDSLEWDELRNTAVISFVTKKTKTSPVTRCVHIEISVDDGFSTVVGTVDRVVNAEEPGYLVAYPVVDRETLADKRVIWEPMAPRVWSLRETTYGVGGALSTPLPLAQFSTWPEFAKGTAKVAGKLLEGTKIAIVNLPIVRVGANADDPASYVYAPFTVCPKGGETTYLFFNLALDGSSYEVWYDADETVLCGGEEISCVTAEYMSFSVQAMVGSPAADRSYMVCSLWGAETDVFRLVRDPARLSLTVYDRDGRKLTTWSSKLAKDGQISLKFSSFDKQQNYELDLFLVDHGIFTGFVTRKPKTVTAGNPVLAGVVDIFGM